MDIVIGKCGACGAIFRGNRRRRFCSRKCSMANYYYKNRDKITLPQSVTKERYPVLFGVVKNNSLKEDAVKAESLGMTYGKYMALKRLGMLEVSK